MSDLNKLENWKEVTRGLYRYVIAASACYEIYILHWDHETDLLSANCNLYVVGTWRDSSGTFFERELLLTGPMAACLQKAVEDFNDNVDEDMEE